MLIQRPDEVPEGDNGKEKTMLIRPQELSPPACCIIQIPHEMPGAFMDENGNEKTM